MSGWEMRLAAPLRTSNSPHSMHPGSSFGSPEKLQFGSRPARILVINPDESVWAWQRRLESLGAQVEALSSGRQAVADARTRFPDLILLDLGSSDLDGLGVLRALKKDSLAHLIPVITLAAADDVDKRIESLDEGAADCIARPYSLAELIARIRAVLQTKGREDLLRRRVTFLEDLAASDPLTSLLNRRAFIDRFHLEMERATRHEHPLSCLILDIDSFKSMNDRYGHQVGDDVLRQIAKVMLDGRRDEDAMCRYGGDEFVWILRGVNCDALLERAEWLRQTIGEAEIPTAEGSFRISVSIGASTYQFKEHGRVSAHTLLEQADIALLEAKREGKNRVIFRQPLGPEDLEAETPGPGPLEGPDAEDRVGRVALGVEAERRLGPTGEPTDAWDAGRYAKLQEELRTLLRSSVKVLAAALEAKDPETMTHCNRVANTAVAIAIELELPPHEVERIRLASLVHDIGKLAVPEAILQKPGPLTPEEWEIVKRHPLRGATMLREAKSFSHLADLVLYHQESFDGRGFPDGLAGREIPLGARVIRVADAFDALMSDRPYRPRKGLDQAKAELRQMAGTTLDPEIVESLLRLLATMQPIDVQITMWREDSVTSESAASRPAGADGGRSDGRHGGT